MRKFLQFYIILVGFCFARVFCNKYLQNDEPTGFEKFIEKVLKEYPSWLIKNNLDPLPVVREPHEWQFDYKGDFANITGKIWGDMLTGHGSIAKFKLTNAILLRGTFNLTIFVEDLEVFGNYEMAGVTAAALSSVDIKGSGCFRLCQWKKSWAQVNIFGFGLTPDGYIDLDKAQIEDDQGIGMKIDYFEGLQAGGYATDVKRLVFRLFDDEFDLSFLYRMTTPLLKYFKEVFANTKVTEIVATAKQCF